MVRSKLSNVDMSDSKTPIVMGIAAAGTEHTLGGSEEEGTSGSGGKIGSASTGGSVNQEARETGSVGNIGGSSTSGSAGESASSSTGESASNSGGKIGSSISRESVSSSGEKIGGASSSTRGSVNQDARKIGSVRNIYIGGDSSSNSGGKIRSGSSIGGESASGIGGKIGSSSDGGGVSGEPHSDVPIEKQESVEEQKEELKSEEELHRISLAFEEADKRTAEGNAFFKKYKYNEATKCYLEAVDIYPDENAAEKSECYQNMAAASEKLGKPDDVVQYCNKALSLNQKYIRAIQRRATAYQKLSNYEESIKDWTAVCLLEGPEKSMKNGYTAITDRVLKAYGDQEAKKLMASRKPRLPSYTVIKSMLDSIHMQDFKATESSESKGDALYKQVWFEVDEGHYSKVSDKLDNALQENPVKFRNQLHCLRGIFAWVMTDYATAISNFDAVIEESKSHIRLKSQAYIHRGEVYQLMGDKKHALADFNNAVQTDENNPDAYLHRAQFFLSLDELDQAIKDLKKSIELDGEFSASWTSLVYGQYQMARTMTPSLLNEVFSNLSKMEEKFPKVADVFVLHGQVLQDQRNFSAAEEKFNEAQRLAPDNVTYMAHAANLKMMAEKNFDSAIELLQKAHEKDPKCDFVLENLGMIYIRKEMYEEALECFNKALDLSRTKAEAAHFSALCIGIKCQLNVCKEYDVKPDIQDFSEITTAPQG